MAVTPRPSEVPVGSVLPGGVAIIPNKVVEQPTLAFEMVIPGRTYRSGPVVVSRVVPRARMVLMPVPTPITPEGVPNHRAARVSAEVTDMAFLCDEAESLQKHLDVNGPLSFAVRFATSASYEELVTLAEVAVGAAKERAHCGCRPLEAAIHGGVSIGMAAGAEGKLQWTRPANGVIYVQKDGHLGYGQDELADCVAVKDNCTDNWEWPECETFCEGHQCTAPEVCHCGVNSNNVPQVRCDGFVRCNCNVV